VKSRKVLGLASWASVVAALFLFGQSAWIYGKARVAQVLLRRAWTGTVRGGKEVKPWPWADTWPVARLSVPSSREDFIVLAGASGRTLAFGPGHLDGSAQPGEYGNCVLSAHRDTQFEFLRRLDVGDTLDLETRDGRRLRYRVFDRRVTQKGDTSVLARTAEPTLTLVTCYPFDAIAPGGPLRYVVRAQLMAARPPLSAEAWQGDLCRGGACPRPPSAPSPSGRGPG
jgi:sortase A